MTAGNYTKAWAAIFAFTALMAADDTDAKSSPYGWTRYRCHEALPN